MSATTTPLPIEWTGKAVQGFEDIVGYLDREHPSASEKLVGAVEDVLDKLKNYPKMYKSGRREGTREAGVGSYILVYREEAASVLILGVFHQRQNFFNI